MPSRLGTSTWSRSVRQSPCRSSDGDPGRADNRQPCRHDSQRSRGPDATLVQGSESAGLPLILLQALIRFRADPSAVNSKGESAISLVSCDMEQQPHFRDFKHSFALRQLVLVGATPNKHLDARLCGLRLKQDKFLVAAIVQA